MKPTADEEILRLLTSEEIIKLIEIYKNNLPSQIRGYNYLITQKRLLELSAVHGPEIFRSCRERILFYTHKNGDIENGTFLTISEPKDYTIFLCSLQESGEEIRDCIIETKLIEWKFGPIFLSTPEKWNSHIMNIIKEKKYEIFLETWNVVAYMPKEKSLEMKINIPDDVYLAALKLEDCDLINSEWPYRYNGSLEFIQDLVALNGGIGIFSKENNKLLCWVLKNEIGAAGMLQTVEEGKRKGYAALVMKAFSKKLAEDDNLDIIGYIVEENKASKKLFESIGFSFLGKNCFLKTKSF